MTVETAPENVSDLVLVAIRDAFGEVSSGIKHLTSSLGVKPDLPTAKKHAHDAAMGLLNLYDLLERSRAHLSALAFNILLQDARAVAQRLQTLVIELDGCCVVLARRELLVRFPNAQPLS
jgi:hypothetical protein